MGANQNKVVTNPKNRPLRARTVAPANSGMSSKKKLRISEPSRNARALPGDNAGEDGGVFLRASPIGGRKKKAAPSSNASLSRRNVLAESKETHNETKESVLKKRRTSLALFFSHCILLYPLDRNTAVGSIDPAFRPRAPTDGESAGGGRLSSVDRKEDLAVRPPFPVRSGLSRPRPGR